LSQLNIQTPRWAVDFLGPARYKGAYGGRCSGKSHFFAELLVEAHILDPNTKSVCIREVQKSLTQSVKALIESKIESLGLGEYFDVQQACIKNTKGNGVIIFQGMNSHNADSIKSLEGFDRAFVEEAQSLSQISLDLLRPTIRKPGSELWFCWNPRNETDPIDVFLRGAKPPEGSIIRPVNYMDNPWMPDVMIKEMEYDKARDIDKYHHVWLGEYVQNSEKRIYKNWKVDTFDSPPDATYYYGLDFGFSNDPTVLLRCFIEGRTLYIDYEAYEIGCDTQDMPHMLMTVPDSEKWPITGDSSRPETISHLRKHGFPKCRPSVKGANSVVDGIEFLRGFDIVVHERCKGIADDLTFYSYKVHPKTEEILPTIDHASSDGPDALRYAVELLRRTSKVQKKSKITPKPRQNYW